jgi:hypothetical protein
MTQTEQVAVGQETLEALIAEHGDIIVSAMGDGLGWRSCSPRGRWQALRLASTRPISNEEVRGLVERWRKETRQVHPYAVPAKKIGDELVTALSHLSAENDRLSAQVAALEPEAVARIEKLEAALGWYAEQVAGCRKLGAVGDSARQALNDDGGERAHQALQSGEARGE